MRGADEESDSKASRQSCPAMVGSIRWSGSTFTRRRISIVC